METYGIALCVVLIAIIVAFFTGHKTLAIGLSVCAVATVILFYIMVVYALRRWSNGGR